MAISKNGPYGHPNGKIGKLVHYMLKGQPVMRMVGKRTKSSPAQLVNCQSMAVTMAFLKPKCVLKFINLGFELEARGTVKNPHNLATSYNKRFALKGVYPNLKMDYSKVKLSQGTLPGPKGTTLTKTQTGLDISWNTTEANLEDHDDDIVMILLYFPGVEDGKSYLNASKREDGKYSIFLGDGIIDEPMEAYMCFKSADGTQISESVYLGNLNGEAETKEEKLQKDAYAALKARFDQISAAYLQHMDPGKGSVVLTKAFRNLETEYRVLKSKLDHLPGKPS